MAEVKKAGKAGILLTQARVRDLTPELAHLLAQHRNWALYSFLGNSAERSVQTLRTIGLQDVKEFPPCLTRASWQHPAMSVIQDNQDNFKIWFKQPLEKLIAERDIATGFVILMVAIPLLERYLREKCGAHEGNLNSQFFTEFETILGLQSPTDARETWDALRNGLLHQATVKKTTGRGVLIAPAQVNMIDYKLGIIHVNPFAFAEKVLEIIEDHFAIFERGVNRPYHEFSQASQGATGAAAIIAIMPKP